MATYEIAATTTIESITPAVLWAVLDDFAGWPEWMPAMENVHVQLLSAGQPRAGYRFRVGNKLVHADLQVEVYSPSERLTSFRLNFPPITGNNRCRLVPLGAGRYRLERVDQIHLPGKLIDVLNATQRERFERLAADFLVALKRTAEQRAQANEQTLTTTTTH